MAEPSEIADYLLTVDFAALDAVGNAALAAELVARWPDATRNDLQAGFEIAALETAAQLAGMAAQHCDEVAATIARATAANPIPA